MASRTTWRRDRRGCRVRATVVGVLVAALALPGPIARAEEHVETFVAFDPAAGQFPEGVAVDQTGNVYVSLVAPVRQIRKIDPSGKTQAVLTDFNDLGVEGLGPAGLAVDARRTVHVVVVGVDLETFQKYDDPEEVELPDTHGVYRVQRDGTTQHLPGTQEILFPNDVTLDWRGNLYVTDTIGGAVWRIPRGGMAERWLQHDLLEGDERFQFGFPIGANGIAFRHNRIIVANTERGLLVEIPIQPDGRAGAPEVLVESPQLVGVDGIALDVHGDVYAATGVNNTVVRVTDGEIETLATKSDGLNQPSTLAFGSGRSGRRNLFVANFSLLSPDPTPGVLRLRADSCRS